MKNLAAELIRLRVQKGWSQSHIARLLKVSVTTYREWEKGRSVPVEVLMDLSELYGISLSSLLGKRQAANEELALALKSFEVGIKHIHSALAKL